MLSLKIFSAAARSQNHININANLHVSLCVSLSLSLSVGNREWRNHAMGLSFGLNRHELPGKILMMTNIFCFFYLFIISIILLGTHTLLGMLYYSDRSAFTINLI